MGCRNRFWTKMKLLAFVALAEASVWIHPEVVAANRALGIPMEDMPGECFFKCTMDLAREEIRCGKHEIGSPEEAQCLADAEANFEACLKVDGCIQADGTCANRCIPKVEEDIAKCEDDYENGLLNDLEFYVCVNKASMTFRNALTYAPVRCLGATATRQVLALPAPSTSSAIPNKKPRAQTEPSIRRQKINPPFFVLFFQPIFSIIIINLVQIAIPDIDSFTSRPCQYNQQ